MQSIEQFVTQLSAAPPPDMRLHSVLTVPSAQAPTCPFPESFPAWLVPALDDQGIRTLAEHQAQALQALAQGQHVCLMAPSGRQVWRTLAMYYDPGFIQKRQHALFLFPYKDRQIAQLQTFHAWNASLTAEHRLDVAAYDGDTPRTQRLAIRQAAPHLIFTTPEMLHTGLLPYHSGWRSFFQGLRYVVVADLHRYNSALLSHMTHILRRLQRVLQHYSAPPQYLFTSAPLTNMAEITQALTAQTCRIVSGQAWQTSPQSRILLESSNEPVTLCRELIAQHQAAGLQPLVLVPGSLLARLAAYQADPSWEIVSTITPEAYHAAELRLLRGECTALLLSQEAPSATIRPVALHSIIFLGLPVSLSHLHTYLTVLASAHPHSLSTLVLSGKAPLERYVLHYPQLYQGSCTQSLPFLMRQRHLIKQHLHCATAEIAFRAGESYPGFPEIAEVLQQLAAQKAVMYRATANAWSILQPQPHRYVRLRSYEPAWTIVQTTDEQLLARVSATRAFRECFPGAIYTDNDRTLHVEHSFPERRRILARPVQADYITSGRIITAVQDKIITTYIEENGFFVKQGSIDYTEKLSAYERLNPYTHQRKSVHILPTSQRQFRTSGTWFTCAETSAMPLSDLRIAAHTLVHAILAGFPVLSFYNPEDLQGGVYPGEQSEQVDIVFLDSQAEGNGISHALYQQYQQVMRIGLQILLHCDCTYGCQNCIAALSCHTCGTNVPYDRQLGMRFLQRLLGEVVPDVDNMRTHSGVHKASAPRCLYLSLTTQKSVDEVGGWQHKHLLGLGVAVTYDTEDQHYRMYTAETVEDLIASLQTADVVIGFNTRDFDYQILQSYTTSALSGLPTLAVLDEIHRVLGFRLSFRHVLRETLDIDRPDDSAQTLQWYQEGERERIAQLCRRDIDLLQRLIAYGNTHGALRYRDHVGTRHDFPISWPAPSALTG